jgi:hypothetical protein
LAIGGARLAARQAAAAVLAGAVSTTGPAGAGFAEIGAAALALRLATATVFVVEDVVAVVDATDAVGAAVETAVAREVASLAAFAAALAVLATAAAAVGRRTARLPRLRAAMTFDAGETAATVGVDVTGEPCLVADAPMADAVSGTAVGIFPAGAAFAAAGDRLARADADQRRKTADGSADHRPDDDPAGDTSG